MRRVARIAIVGARSDSAFRALEALPEHAEVCTFIGAAEDLKGSACANVSDCNVLLMAPTGHSGKEILDALLDKMPNLEWIHSRWAGVDSFLTPKLVAREDIPLTNARGVFSSSLAEYTMFACGWFSKRARELQAHQAQRKWEKLTVKELRGATMGVAGFGDIGRACATLAKAYGMRILAQRRRPELSDSDILVDETFGAGQEELCRMAAKSDYFVVAAPLTPQTYRMINADVLANAKPGAVLVNIGRGPLVDENALCDALEDQEHPLGGAALDVFEEEPLSESSRLWENPNALLSPHCADQTPTFMTDSIDLFVENVKLFLAGEPLRNLVDKEAGY